MEIVKKLPDNIKFSIFEFNPYHRKNLNKVHKELKHRLRTCESYRCNSLIDIKRNAYYQTKIVNKKHMSYFCCWQCCNDEQFFQQRNRFLNTATSADTFMYLMTQ